MNKEDEMIFVVPREKVITEAWTGLKTDGLEGFEETMREFGEFKRRGDMENDPTYKQLIPYIVFQFEDKYFLMQRGEGGGEVRLHNRASIGIGGHLNEEDLEGRPLDKWWVREFNEEVEYKEEDLMEIKPVGLINNDQGVGEVHLGYLMLFTGKTPNIRIQPKEESENVLVGKLATVAEIEEVYENLEEWSKFAFDYLKNK